MDEQVLENKTAIVGGGDINKLVELRTEDIMTMVKPVVADLIKNGE